MAQDFHAAFRMGASDRHIHTGDADGIALVAIQALAEQNVNLAEQNTVLQTQMAALQTSAEQNVKLQAQMAILLARVAVLEQQQE